MYRELQPFREALSQQLKASLFPAMAGIDPNKLLETYLVLHQDASARLG